MSASRESTSVLVRFLDSFLHEQNIKWLLSVGMLILLGSSLRLVSLHWVEYTAFWKYGILMAYTGAIFVASQISYFRMGLRRTGTVLMVLTVLLVPITFLALHWIRPGGSLELNEIAQQTGLVLLLGLNLILSGFATHRVFVHFLRKPQPTFQFAYLALCLAGAVAPGLPAGWSKATAVILWALFTVGTLKVNRHVFWLMEEERRPRIFGFFPIALLGAQFLGLFAFNLAAEIEVQWWGLACVLVAVPVLLTSDSVARVFQQRTGDLVRPLPASIIVPLVTGLILCAAGLCLALSGIPRPYAIVPTAALAAVALGVVAHRTQHQAFAWGVIGCVLMAYQFSPLFFLEFARTVVQSGAAAVHEAKLPYAFYGLTYLPVLIVFTGVSFVLHRLANNLFAIPLRQASIFLAGILLVAASGHPKATFPVCLSMLAVFAVQTVAFADRRLLIPANLALIGAALGFIPFQETILGSSHVVGSPLICLTVAAILQLLPGRLIDRVSLRLEKSDSPSGISPQICQAFSLAVTLMTAMNWSWIAIRHFGAQPPLLMNFLLGGLMIAHALIWLHPAVGVSTLVFLNLSMLLHALSFRANFDALMLFVTCIMLLQWAIGSVLHKWPTWRVSKAFSGPLKMVSGVGLVMLVMGVVLPLLYMGHFHQLHVGSMWFSCVLITAWCFVAAWQIQRTFLATTGFALTLGLSSALVIQQFGWLSANPWLPLIWASAAIALLGAYRVAKRHFAGTLLAEAKEATSPLGLQAFQIFETLTPAVLCCVLIGTLLFLGWPSRLAAGVAIAGLLWRRRDGVSLIPREAVFCLANWQGLCVLMHLMTGRSGSLLTLSPLDWELLLFPVSAFTALSLLLIEILLCVRTPAKLQIVQFHRAVVGLLPCTLLMFSFHRQPWLLSTPEILLALSTFGCLAMSQCIRACRRRSTSAVWIAEATFALGVIYLAVFGAIDLKSGWGMYALLGISFGFHVAAKISAGYERLQILAGPFRTTAFWLPMGTVGLGILRFCWETPDTWKGFNSLALLLAAAFYFQQGLERNQRRLWVLAAAIVNVALALLWGELHWRDPQLFMIPIGASILLLTELLSREIPEQFQNPLRYLGALTILVSPTFEIVGGSWLHLLTLMIAAVLIILLAIGLRVRSLIYTGTAFLIADLIAMVIRGGVDHPNLLWSAGVALGMGVMALAAYCEHHRESLMSRIRYVSAELETWK